MQRVINLLKSQFKELFNEVLSVFVSREKQKNFLGTSLYRNALYLVMTNLAAPFTSFIFWIIVARLYSSEDIGLASAALSVMTLLTLIATLGFEFGLVRYLANSGKNASLILNTIFTVVSLITIVVCFIFLTGIEIWSPALLPLREHPLYFVAFVLFSTVTVLILLLQNAFIAQRKTNFVMLGSLVAGFLKLPLPFLFTLFLQPFGSIIFAQGIPGIIAFFGMIFFLPKVLSGFRFLPSLSLTVLGKILRFSFANYVANMLWSFTIYVLPLLVVNILGAEANAYFFVTWTIGGVLGTIPGATSTSLFAEGSFDNKKFTSDIRKCLKMTFIILVPLAVIVFALADKLLLIYGTAYSLEGTVLLRMMAFAVLPLALNVIYMSILRVNRKSIELILISVFVIVITLTLSWLLLPRMGIIACGIGWLASQSAVSIYALNRLLKLQRR